MLEEQTIHGDRQSRVLVVDDDPGVRLVCTTTLELDGFDVIEAANGQEAIALALAHAPDLVLLDISMPVLDGFGVAAALRADTRTNAIPIVFLTGETDPSVRARAWSTGALGVFGKPFNPMSVNAFIGLALERVAQAGRPSLVHAAGQP